MNRFERLSESDTAYKRRSLLDLVRWLYMVSATSIMLASATGIVAILSDGHAFGEKTTKVSPRSDVLPQLSPATAVSIQTAEMVDKAEVGARAPRRSSETGYSMPALAVDRMISGKPGHPSAFHLSISADGVVPDHSVIEIRGLPKGAVLSAGRSDGAGAWLLAPDDLDAGLSITPGDDAYGSNDLVVQLLTPEGRVASELHARLVVSGEERANDNHKLASTTGPEEIEVLLAHGRELQRVGYLAGARLFFQRAAEAGSAEGARALGETYDPVEFQKLGVRGMVPDPALARMWYDRARALEERPLKQTGATE